MVFVALLFWYLLLWCVFSAVCGSGVCHTQTQVCLCCASDEHDAAVEEERERREEREQRELQRLVRLSNTLLQIITTFEITLCF